MTTIAWDGRTLAADRMRVTGTLKSFASKIHRGKAPSGSRWLFAGAGSAEASERVAHWLRTGGDPDKRPTDLEDFTGLLIEGGVCYRLERNLHPFEVSAPVAIGSGGDFAVAFMLSGMSAKKAVEATADLDCYTGGGVDTARLK